ncbi:hypothetical protein [Micromonospora sp. 067-2]|uniref:hypothetical protein n=1 Tax=Micromonospora sp. 067-2 TaxID=2789270 RepID=UPI00397B43E9
MALHRITGNPRSRAVAPLALGAATALILVTGCDNLSFRRLDYDNTEAAKITTIRVLPGAGDLVVQGTGSATEVRIKRVVRYQGGEPNSRYEIKGSELVLDADCGDRCTISYEVTAGGRRRAGRDRLRRRGAGPGRHGRPATGLG